MKVSAEAKSWAARQRFSALTGAQTIIEAYEAHLRILAKIAARKAAERT